MAVFKKEGHVPGSPTPDRVAQCQSCTPLPQLCSFLHLERHNLCPVMTSAVSTRAVSQTHNPPSRTVAKVLFSTLHFTSANLHNLNIGICRTVIELNRSFPFDARFLLNLSSKSCTCLSFCQYYPIAVQLEHITCRLRTISRSS